MGDHGHELVAIDDIALFIDDDDPVGISIERNADISAGFLDLFGHRFRRRRANLVIDIVAIGLDADGDDLRPQLPQRERGNLVGRTIGAIEHHAQPGQVDIGRQRALGIFDVAGARLFLAIGPADLHAVRQHMGQIAVDQPLDIGLHLVGKLVAIRAEQLDAVIVIGIVRRRDHHAQIRAQRTRQHGHGRRRHRPQKVDIHAHRGKSGGQRGLDHIAGAPRILADHHAIAVVTAHELGASGHADLEGKLGCQFLAIGFATDAVGSEILPDHIEPRLCVPMPATAKPTHWS